MVSVTSEKVIEEKKTVSFRARTREYFSTYEVGSLTIFSILMFVFSFFMFLPILSISISAFNFAEPFELESISLGSFFGLFDLDIQYPTFIRHFIYCFENANYRESIFNSLFAGLTTTIICSLIGLTVTIIFSRYHFTGKRYFQILAIVPLVSPPFVGAFALSRLLDRNGIVANFFQLFIPDLPDLLGSSIWAIIFLQSIHLWPLMFFNTAASYSKIDPAQEEQARNLGSWGLNLYRQIILPLVTPGFIAGAVLVFIWSVSDLGTPIVLNFHKFAPFLAFRDISDQEASYVEAAYALVIILLVVSLLALLFASKVVGMRDYAPEKVSGMEQTRLMQQASRPKTILILFLLSFLSLLSLLPHIGLIVVAFVERIKYGEILPTLWTFDGVTTAFGKADIVTMIFNSLVYSALAMIITIALGVVVAYLIVRKKNLKGISIIMTIIGAYVGLLLGSQLTGNITNTLERNLLLYGFCFVTALAFFLVGRSLNLRCLEIFSTMPFAVPGIVLAAGYLTFFSPIDSIWGLLPTEFDGIPILGIFTGILRQFLVFFTGELFSLLGNPNNPLNFRFTSFWFILVVSYSMRRMPYTVQSSTAILRQIHESLEEVAHNLGASSATTFRRITLPLMTTGVLAGGILTFITSFTEVSTSIMIPTINGPFLPFYSYSKVSDPLTKGIYDEITRGAETMPAGVMGIVQLLVAAIGMTLTQKLLGERTGTAFGG
ncbi:MAG: ABC transporter permease [Promethearchaeota archaeon]